MKFDVPIKTTPEQLWKALTEAPEITKWYAPEARVVPGQGGSIWLSWGAGCEGEAKIEVWEPGKCLRTAAPMAVEYSILSENGQVILRLVQSGFSPDANFEEEYQSTFAGWTTMFKALQHSLERHPGTSAVTVSVAGPSGLPQLEAFQRISALLPESAVAVEGHPPGYGGFVLQDQNDSYFAVFCEGRKKTAVTLMCVLYGPARDQADEFKCLLGKMLLQ
ncbi:MAG TPA: SRPBCC domain-containing protein [Bryobacteraceae bacterium]|nr:SRPBCC domain-containing protein [Bryobacteraceae bacterium]